MVRQNRKVIAVNMKTGERVVFESTYACSIHLCTANANVRQALERNGVCCGWKLYDSPETLRARISDLKRQLAELEA